MTLESVTQQPQLLPQSSLVIALVFSLYRCCDMHDKKNDLKWEGFLLAHCLKIRLDILVERAWRWSYIPSTSKQGEMDAFAQLTFSFSIRSRTPGRVMLVLTLVGVFSPQLAQSRYYSRHVQGFVSMAILKPPGCMASILPLTFWPAGDPGKAVRDQEQSVEEVQAAREAGYSLAHASLPEGQWPFHPPPSAPKLG